MSALRIVITGSSKGIGRYLAEYYLSKGCLVFGCSRTETDLKHDRYTHFKVDVSSENDVVAMIRNVAHEHSGIDALVNNAGMASMNHVTMTPAKSAAALMSINFGGAFFFLREASKVMMRARSGRIVNFTTVAVPLRLDGEAIYAASKSAVETLTRIAARELGGFNITVNAVGPTPIQTDLIRAVPKGKIEALVQRQAIRRFGKFEDVANVVDFFLRPESAFVTGQTIYLGGVS